MVTLRDDEAELWDTPVAEEHGASRLDVQVQLKDHFIHRNHQCIVFELLADNLYELIKKTEFQASAAHKQKNAHTHAHTETHVRRHSHTRFSQALAASLRRLPFRATPAALRVVHPLRSWERVRH